MRLLADWIIDDLIAAQNNGELGVSLDLAVVGYRDVEGPAPISLLPDEQMRPHFVNLATLAAMDVPVRNKSGFPRKWCANLEMSGQPDPAAALSSAHWILQRRMAERPFAFPPMVVHCCDGDALASDYELVAGSLATLEVDGRASFLFHCVFTEGHSGRMTPPLYTGRLTESLQRLWNASSLMPQARPNCLGHAPRALSINDWPLQELRQAFDALTTFISRSEMTTLEESGPLPEREETAAAGAEPVLENVEAAALRQEPDAQARDDIASEKSSLLRVGLLPRHFKPWRLTN